MSYRALLHIIFLKRSNRFLVLLISMVLFFATYPIVENSFLAERLLNLFFMLILFSGVYAIALTRRPLIISLILALLIISFRWINYFYQFDFLLMLEQSINVIFWIYIAFDILKFILSQRVITGELIYASLAVYFIFGLGWASIYQLLEFIRPDSFSMPDSEASQQTFIFQMWYFSMVTLTTLGYGDIAPATMTARVFVVLEAILGQFYLAVLIASLIGRRIAQEK